MALTLFAEHGYSATTMDDIAEAAGVTKPLVYQHFESKRALYLELVDVVSHELIDRIVQATAAAEGPRQQVELGFAGYFELMVDNELAFRLLYGRDAPDDAELGAALRRVEETIAQAIDPLIDAGLDPDHRLLLAHAVVGHGRGGQPPLAGRPRRQPDGPPGPTVRDAARPGGRGGPPGRPAGRLRLGRAPPGPPHLTDGAGRQTWTVPTATGWLADLTTPPATSSVMANADTPGDPATLKGTMPGWGPSSPSEIVRDPTTPHSW